MSAKKKKPHRPRRAAAPGADRPPAPGGAPRTAARTPVVVDEPRPRWPLALWAGLVLVWVAGSAVFLVLYLAEALYLLTEEVTDAGRRAAGSYLLGLVVCALGAPLAGAVAAAVLRRRIAAILFGVALAVSALALFTVAPPGEVAAALTGSLG
ncbi:hypothetical protein [Nocardiopsis trehalosi]|uniref:hypothetical protein n=1 Tax=Nocardiopsis trehalosi TaxID=109329 RepID=UPI0008320D4C|nr:hypothetical protein [Nocardiopsis trehalosi]